MADSESIENGGKGGVRSELTAAARKSVVYAGGRLLSQAVGFLMIPVYTRYIEPGNYGAMELIEILSSCIVLLLYMGISESMARFYYSEAEQGKRNDNVLW